MQRGLMIAALIGLIAAIAFWGRPDAGARSVASEAGTPVATPTTDQAAAELADLRNRVAALSTRVAELGGADAEAVAGRLGGSRAGFDAVFGRPSAYLAANHVAYDIPGIGRVSVEFTADRATTISLTPPRPADLPLDQRDASDWTDETALTQAARFYPADATTENATGGDSTSFTQTGSSEALTAAITPADEQGCPASGATPITATFTRSSPETVSAIAIESAPPGDRSLLPVDPVPAAEGQLSQGGSRAVANSSLGGTVNVNGVQVIATTARPNAEGPRPAPSGYELYTVDLQVENQTAEPLAYDLSDFLLVDRRGSEATAICGGIEPAITRGELAAGAGMEGVVTFEVPAKFRAERFVFLVNGARVGFLLR